MKCRKSLIACVLSLVLGSASTGFAQSGDTNDESEVQAPAVEAKPQGTSTPPKREERGDRRGRSRGPGGDGRGAATPPSGKSDTKAGTKSGDGKSVARYGAGRVLGKKTAASLTLPPQHAARDANRDGQIGMYEWSKTDLSTFRKLDLNGDGFLVPSEFANPGTRTVSTTTIVPGSVGSAGGSPSGDKPASPANGPTPSSPTSKIPLSSDPKTAEAELAFGLRDLNKDGQLDQEEFDGSVRIKRVFEKAKMTFTGPMSKEKFLEVYQQALLAKEAKPS